jgi:hypothetical protein
MRRRLLGSLGCSPPAGGMVAGLSPPVPVTLFELEDAMMSLSFYVNIFKFDFAGMIYTPSQALKPQKIGAYS